ncbi:class I SAM-dependent methyltransferase [Paenibacillus sp. PAMC21692]|uniref:class I SAM-dependent methyltransferase n=1 Tax=Paenibacillus sp. PAMC21692 TaxID=2762320 RepID=UPI00164D40E3|nr:class I SAM-dependent methyltransferase [Paenibacillus sp. PAMC21692]QNK55246.1 class I SAM-dependent methyltransferase [Paenibacillus sp. PAMC21692]
MIVTTAPMPSERVLAQARRLADELSAAYVQRRSSSVRKLLERSGDGRAIVVTDREIRFYDGDEAPPLFFHPSMAFIRVKRLRKGESDPLLDLSGCRPGDTVIDCTAGMAADSLVFSYAVGTAGTVVALESEPILCALVREGLSAYESGLEDVNDAMRRIKMICREHGQYLAEQPDNSADIVYFDPMFRQPILESSAIGAFRSIANMDALTTEVVEQAKRVARRTVIMKEHQGSGEYERLGFEKRHINTSKIAYGVIHVD